MLMLSHAVIVPAAMITSPCSTHNIRSSTTTQHYYTQEQPPEPAALGTTRVPHVAAALVACAPIGNAPTLAPGAFLAAPRVSM
ncbi:hypothetical protein Pelo_6086 [Pelomyxa schiedti]|nr:hypothetical protein Pelo_6086 [Pelomyxa schiedti]